MPRDQLKFFITLVLSLLILTNTAYSFDSQGHRGARGLLAENTLPAFSKALAIGVNTVELDTLVSSDNVIVITHNPRLQPEITRNKEGVWLEKTGPAIYSLTLKQLISYDVGGLQPGTKYQARFPQQVTQDGIHIPTLVELIQLVQRSGNTEVRLNIETKLQPMEPDLTPDPDKFIALLLKTLNEHNFIDRVTIQSFDWRTLQQVQKQAPAIPTSYLTAQQSWLDNIQSGQTGASAWTAGFDIDNFDGNVAAMIKAAGGHIWSPYHREVSATKIKQAHALGLKVKVWTVNNADRMQSLINMGVDGIITDYPDKLRAVLKKLNMDLPEQAIVSP